MWLYTEITEYHKRRDFVQEVDSFMHKGRRFTWEDGEALKARVRKLEQQEAIENHLKQEKEHIKK